jgi:hypothetical protein
MRILAFIEQPAAIEKILTRLGLWPARAHSPAEGYRCRFLCNGSSSHSAAA